MRVGISEDEANTTVDSLVKWAQWLAEVITALKNFLINIGILDGEVVPEEEQQ